VAWPLASALLLAAVLAVVLDPLQHRLASRLRGRQGIAFRVLVVAWCSSWWDRLSGARRSW